MGIYQKTRMCLFIYHFILHLKSGYCSNWIRGKDLSPKEPWPHSPIQQGWKSQDNEWSLMPSHEEALSTADISFLPSLSSLCSTLGQSKVVVDPAMRALVDRKEGRSLGDGFRLSGLGAIAPIRFNRYSLSTYCVPGLC